MRERERERIKLEVVGLVLRLEVLVGLEEGVPGIYTPVGILS
jgi:hypothetical protein